MTCCRFLASGVIKDNSVGSCIKHLERFVSLWNICIYDTQTMNQNSIVEFVIGGSVTAGNCYGLKCPITSEKACLVTTLVATLPIPYLHQTPSV